MARVYHTGVFNSPRGRKTIMLNFTFRNLTSYPANKVVKRTPNISINPLLFSYQFPRAGKIPEKVLLLARTKAKI